jgi:hypothetical protein
VLFVGYVFGMAGSEASSVLLRHDLRYVNDPKARVGATVTGEDAAGIEKRSSPGQYGKAKQDK